MQTNKPRPEILLPYRDDQSLLITGPFAEREKPAMGWHEFAQKCVEADRDPWTEEAFADWLRLHGIDE